MQATLPLHQIAMNPKENRLKSSALPAGNATSLEIHSFLAARDLLLREAEANATESNLRRAWAANEFAESCLRPAPSPYQAQALPETEAAHERLRCSAIKARLAELRVCARRRRRAA